MQKDPAETKRVMNIIGGKHPLTQEKWAVSIVRKYKSPQHAYLILEGLNEKDARIVMDAHLMVKKGTDEQKGLVVFRQISVSDLEEVGNNCHSYTWGIRKEQGQALVALIESEAIRANNNEINYTLFGKAKFEGALSNSFFSKTSVAKLEQMKHSSVNSKSNYYSHASCDMLLRGGHNCYSWAKAMIKAIQLEYPASIERWSEFVAVIPMDLKGIHDADNEEKSGCSLM